MNKVTLIGRLTKDPDISTAGELKVARYTLAVDRKFKKEGQQSADFISIVCFGATAEFASRFLSKGKRIAVIGRIQTGSYTNREGQKVYTTDVVVEEHEFVESKGTGSGTGSSTGNAQKSNDEFMSIPDGVDAELPFN